jgi:hypothetical protein
MPVQKHLVGSASVQKEIGVMSCAQAISPEHDLSCVDTSRLVAFTFAREVFVEASMQIYWTIVEPWNVTQIED